MGSIAKNIGKENNINQLPVGIKLLKNLKILVLNHGYYGEQIVRE